MVEKKISPSLFSSSLFIISTFVSEISSELNIQFTEEINISTTQHNFYVYFIFNRIFENKLSIKSTFSKSSLIKEGKSLVFSFSILELSGKELNSPACFAPCSGARLKVWINLLNVINWLPYVAIKLFDLSNVQLWF